MVGGIALQRFGQNALDVIDNVKAKLARVAAGLPEGVRIVTVYDRSELIHRAIDTLKTTLIEESLIVAAVCIVFLLHVRSALVAIVTLPVGVLIAFIAMHALGHRLQHHEPRRHRHRDRRHGRRGDRHDRERAQASRAAEAGPIAAPRRSSPRPSKSGRRCSSACWSSPCRSCRSSRLRTRKAACSSRWPLPRRCHGGRGAAVDHAGAGADGAVRARPHPARAAAIRSTGSLIWLYRPLLRLVLRARLLTVVAGARRYWASRRARRRGSAAEFMPRLDEGTLLYMPVTLPGLSVTKAAELLQTQDKIIKSFPEVASVFGKAGRAETATDPAPLAMFETVVNLKPKVRMAARHDRGQADRRDGPGAAVPRRQQRLDDADQGAHRHAVHRHPHAGRRQGASAATTPSWSMSRARSRRRSATCPARRRPTPSA